MVKKKDEIGFINEVSIQQITEALNSIRRDPAYLAVPSYRGASERWDYDYVSFVDYHLNYLKMHPTLNPQQYISNLRLSLRKAPR